MVKKGARPFKLLQNKTVKDSAGPLKIFHNKMVKKGPDHSKFTRKQFSFHKEKLVFKYELSYYGYHLHAAQFLKQYAVSNNLTFSNTKRIQHS